MKLSKVLSSLFVVIALALTAGSMADGEFKLVGPDGKVVQSEVSKEKINSGTGQVMLYGGLIFAAIVSIGVIVMAIMMALGKRQWVQEHLMNVIASILLFAFGAGAIGAIATKLA